MQKFLYAGWLLSVVLCYFYYSFALGFFDIEQGFIMLLPLMMLFGPPVATLISALILKGLSWRRHLLVCLGLYAVIFGGFPALSPGARAWTNGFAVRVRLTKNPDKIQKWAIVVLKRYEQGKLETETNAEYWAAGRERIAEREISKQIQNLWWDKPSIGIVTMTENGSITDPATLANPSVLGLPDGPVKKINCVAFSWYLTGLLVGPPDFKTTWNPWYIRQIIPGVYAYCGVK